MGAQPIVAGAPKQKPRSGAIKEPISNVKAQMSKIIWLNVIQFSNNAIILYSPEGVPSISDGRSPSLQVRQNTSREAAQSKSQSLYFPEYMLILCHNWKELEVWQLPPIIPLLKQSYGLPGGYV